MSVTAIYRQHLTEGQQLRRRYERSQSSDRQQVDLQFHFIRAHAPEGREVW
jgi:hypothetical protein